MNYYQVCVCVCVPSGNDRRNLEPSKEKLLSSNQQNYVCMPEIKQYNWLPLVHFGVCFHITENIDILIF